MSDTAVKGGLLDPKMLWKSMPDALRKLDPEGRHDAVINLQGDMPFVDPSVIGACARLLETQAACDIATVVAPEASAADRANPDVVKAVLALPDGVAPDG